MLADALKGLQGEEKSIPPVWFYDERGSQLFEQITVLPEYYPTRAERSILRERAALIAEQTQARTLVELGSGSSEKTRLLLSALRDAGSLRCYVPVDVNRVGHGSRASRTPLKAQRAPGGKKLR